MSSLLRVLGSSLAQSTGELWSCNVEQK